MVTERVVVIGVIDIKEHKAVIIIQKLFLRLPVVNILFVQGECILAVVLNAMDVKAVLVM
jgi:hypothetical protein